MGNPLPGYRSHIFRDSLAAPNGMAVMLTTSERSFSLVSAAPLFTVSTPPEQGSCIKITDFAEPERF